ncbi:kinase-like domain-containing protein [Xylariomycetidae sp. FL2044]|nr:kinase-like domain-containing protein [Xylariomycetidae sp. FL2044]
MASSGSNVSSWSPNIPPHPGQLRAIGVRATEIIEYFSTYDPRFEYVKRIGDSSLQGGALLFNERSDQSFSPILRKIVIKYFSAPRRLNVVADNEYEMLAALRGAEHIVQLIGEGKLLVNGNMSIVMEYIGHGTLQDFLSRFSASGRPIPNRILWNIFLCLVRASIAMTYPPHGSLNDGIERERIPDGGKPDRSIIHSDMHLLNILLGTFQPLDAEHKFGPLVRLIDFGSAFWVNRDGEGKKSSEVFWDEAEEIALGEDPEASNVMALGEVMSILAIGSDRMPEDEGRRVMVGGTEPFVTRAPVDLDDAPIMQELREVIYMCLAEEEDQRPDLDALLEVCENKVYDTDEREWDFLLNGVAETDQAIRRVIESVVLNADWVEEAQRARAARPQTVAEITKQAAFDNERLRRKSMFARLRGYDM